MIAAVVFVLASNAFATCEAEPLVHPLADVASIPACGAEPSGGVHDVINLNADLTEGSRPLSPIELVVSRPSGNPPEGWIGPYPKPKTTITFYDKHLLMPSIGDQPPMNGSTTVNDDGTFEIWVPAYRNGGYKERSVRITGKLGPGNAITIDEYRYTDDFVHTSSLDSSKTKSVREYKRGPVTICR